MCRHIRTLSIAFARIVWTSTKEILAEIRDGSLTLPHIIASLRNCNPYEFLKRNVSPYLKEVRYVVEAIRPVVYAIRTVYHDLDRPTKVYAMFLSGATLFLLFKTLVYARHRKRNEIDLKDKVSVVFFSFIKKYLCANCTFFL